MAATLKSTLDRVMVGRGYAVATDAYGGDARSEWINVDWARHMRWLWIEKRWMRIVDIGDGPVVLFVHGLSGCWKNWLENIPRLPAIIASSPWISRVSASPRCQPRRSRSAATRTCSTTSWPSWTSTVRGSSATRWAASSGRSSRSATPPACNGSCSCPLPG